jgi:hypothetical protein
MEINISGITIMERNIQKYAIVIQYTQLTIIEVNNKQGMIIQNKCKQMVFKNSQLQIRCITQNK